jgi:hypothetical protein
MANKAEARESAQHTHGGTGDQFNNDSTGPQYNKTGPGNQVNANTISMSFSKNIFSVGDTFFALSLSLSLAMTRELLADQWWHR